MPSIHRLCVRLTAAVNESMLLVRAELSKNVSHCITQTNDAIRTRLAELTKSKVSKSGCVVDSYNRTMQHVHKAGIHEL